MNAKQYLDDNRGRMLELFNGRVPDCFIVYKTHPDRGIVGEPLAVFQRFDSLYEKLQGIADDLDGKFGIQIGSVWFDDDPPEYFAPTPGCLTCGGTGKEIGRLADGTLGPVRCFCTYRDQYKSTLHSN